MHGDLDQHTRVAVLAAFKAGTHHVLVATDVAARGLDIRSIKTVVNFDAAKDIETHVHRIGRTGRAGDKEGVALTLVTPKEARFAGKHAPCPGTGSGRLAQSALLGLGACSGSRLRDSRWWGRARALSLVAPVTALPPTGLARYLVANRPRWQQRQALMPDDKCRLATDASHCLSTCILDPTRQLRTAAGELADCMAAANQAVPPALLGVAKKDAAFRKAGKSGTGYSGGRGRGRKPVVSPVPACWRKCCALRRPRRVHSLSWSCASGADCTMAARPACLRQGPCLQHWGAMLSQPGAVCALNMTRSPSPCVTGAHTLVQVGGAGLGFALAAAPGATAAAASSAADPDPPPLPPQQGLSAPASKQAAAFESNFARGGLESTVTVSASDKAAAAVSNAGSSEPPHQAQQPQQHQQVQQQQQQQQQSQPHPPSQQQSEQQQQPPGQQQSASHQQAGPGQGRDGLRTAAVSRFRNSFVAAGTAGVPRDIACMPRKQS